MKSLKLRKPDVAENEMDEGLLFRINALVKMTEAVVEFNKSYSAVFEKKLQNLKPVPSIENKSSIINMKLNVEKIQLKKQGKAS